VSLRPDDNFLARDKASKLSGPDGTVLARDEASKLSGPDGTVLARDEADIKEEENNRLLLFSLSLEYLVLMCGSL